MIKQKELLILKHLRKNGRSKLVDIAKKTQIPVTSVFEYVKKYEGNIIKKFATIIDFRKIGYSTRAYMVFKIKREHREPMREYLCNSANVNSLYKINNGYDFMVEGIFRELKDMEEFIEKLEEKFELKQKNIYYIIDDIQREVFLSNILL